MRKRSLFWMIALVILSLLVTACAGRPAPTPTSALEVPQAAEATLTPVPEQPTSTPVPAGAALGTEANPIRLVWVPSGDTQKILAGAEKLDALLAKQGIYVKSSVATSYAAAIEALCAGQVDAAALATLSYVLAHDKCGAEVILNSIRRGSATYNGQILVRADSGINTIADLKGKKFAFTDPASTSGYLYAVALLKANGVDPAKDLAEAVFAGSHNAAALAVYNGQVDAAATYVDVRNSLERDFPDIKEKTKVIAQTEPIPNDTITVSKNMPADLKERFKQALLALMQTEEGKQAGYEIYEWDGLAESNDALFEPVRVAAAALGIELQNWKGQSVPYKFGLVTDVGKIDDKSFNESSWNALLNSQKRHFAEVKYIVTVDPKDYAKNIATFAEDGYDVIVVSGFALGPATLEAAQKYPNVKFIGVDIDVEALAAQAGIEVPKNFAGLIFEEDKAGFLAGALAGLMTKSNVIGAVLGTDLVPPVWRFGEGYKAGAKYVNPNVEVIVVYHSDVGFDKTFDDPEWGKTTALSMIDKGADLIFGAGGKTGNGALYACAETQKCYAIGVDQDQYYSVPEAQKVLITSAMKLITPGVENLINQAVRGTFKGGNFKGEVGLAPFHDLESQVPQAVKDKLAEIEQGLKNGSIQTGVLPAKPQ